MPFCLKARYGDITAAAETYRSETPYATLARIPARILPSANHCCGVDHTLLRRFRDGPNDVCMYHLLYSDAGRFGRTRF